jgi:CheY-like chemotaxis protein
MPNGGSLKIETSSVLVDETFIHERGLGEKGLYAVISVSDSGIGMDEKTREKIFDPFFTTKEVGKGTGLGLSTVYGVLQQHKGFVEVLSQPGRGTTFHVYLPAINQIADSESAQKVAYSEGGCETILVAEDNDSSRTLVKRVLAGKGYTVIEAVDGDDAVQKYSQFRHQISMLLLDVVMPQKNGMEAYNEIRTLEPSIKVLFMSGYTGEVVFDKGMKDDSFDFISKPFAPNDLLLQIRKLLDKQH